VSDREQLLDWEEEKRLVRQAREQMAQQEVAAEALARFCCVFYDALGLPSDSVPRFSHEERVRLVEATLRGR